MPFAPGDEIVELSPDWLESDPEWGEIESWLIEEVITDWLADTDAGDYF